MQREELGTSSSGSMCFYNYGCFKDGCMHLYFQKQLEVFLVRMRSAPWSVNMLHGLQSHRITKVAPVVKCSFGFPRILVDSICTLFHCNLTNGENYEMSLHSRKERVLLGKHSSSLFSQVGRKFCSVP